MSVSAVHSTISTILLSLLCSASVAACRPAMEETLKNPEGARISPEDQILTAYHEAGHAVVCKAVLGDDCVLLHVRVYSQVHGKNWGVTTTESAPLRGSAYKHRAYALVLKAGAAAEEILLHADPSKDDVDADNAKFELLGYCWESGQCECPPESRFEGKCVLTGWLVAERDRLYADAQACVRANLSIIMELAERLILLVKKEGTERTLTQAGLNAFFETHEVDTSCSRRVKVK